MRMKVEDFSKYVVDENFLEFLTREFDLAAHEATVEELGEFAFGSMREAAEAFKGRRSE